jgi:hypothetical protein
MKRFEGCWHRIDRATVHRNASISEWNAFLDQEPYETRLTQDYNKAEWTLWIEQTIPMPPGIALNLGEWLYQLRGALDNCVYEVAIYDSGSDPPPNHDRLEFPIHDRLGSFRRAAKHKLAPLSDKHRSWIESVQPFQPGDDGKVIPERTVLYWVNELARIDRHRSLHVVGAYVAESDPLVRAPAASSIAITNLSAEGPIFVDGDGEIARIQIAPWAEGDDVEANAQTALDPELREWTERKPAPEFWERLTFGERLRFFELFVKAIIGRFERDCTGWTRVDELLKPET